MVELESIDVLGGGPSGLYVAQLLKRDQPHSRVRVLEQNPRGATFGFGVVFSSEALSFLETDDPETHAMITPQMERWQNMTLVHQGENVVLDGIGFASIGRLQLIELLSERAEAQGVEVVYNTTIDDISSLKADLVVGADGLNSLVRRTHEASFSPKVSEFDNRFAWFGTNKAFDTLTQTFLTTEHGAMNAHHYRYQPAMSTFIVECDAKSFRAHGFDSMDEQETARACEEIFSDTLQGASLITNKSQWRQFPKMWCENWAHENRVLIGDSAHTAHFSVGSGTRLAMEDSIALAKALREGVNLQKALATYQETRQPIAHKIVNAANTSANWYETFANKMQLSPLDFGFDYITRSGRIDMDRLRKLSPNFMHQYEAKELQS
ncbi:MAG: FAD-dependent monooxygenase [Nitratireductor sp.]